MNTTWTQNFKTLTLMFYASNIPEQAIVAE